MTDQHNHSDNVSDSRLLWAIGLNQLLTVAQIVAGLLSGSLSLLADALHNFNDAMALLIAYVARRWSRKKANERFTFGYHRAELIGAMINLTTLVIVGLYLIYEAVVRFFQPQAVEGWTVTIVAGLAILVDVGTAVLLRAMSRGNLNIRAAFIHNISDALSSVAVLIGGVCMLLFGWYVVDPILTLLIAGYVLYQGVSSLRAVAAILMEGAPEDVDQATLIKALEAVEGVRGVHHLHVWRLDEQHNALEVHVVVVGRTAVETLDRVKRDLKRLLGDQFGITHSTLEIEFDDGGACDDGGCGGHEAAPPSERHS